TVPSDDETSANLYYRVQVKARDSHGQVSSAFIDLVPHKVSLRLETEPPGLRLFLDGASVVTPLTFDSVVGVQHTFAPVFRQWLAGYTYRFESWSDGAPERRTEVAPEQGATFKAI